MRLKLCPSKSAVLDILSAKLGSRRASLFTQSEDLEKLKSDKTDSKLYNPYTDSKIAVAEGCIAAISGDVQMLEQQIAFLNSHEAPKVMVEFDL